jgi:hypothetical protein
VDGAEFLFQNPPHVEGHTHSDRYRRCRADYSLLPVGDRESSAATLSRFCVSLASLTPIQVEKRAGQFRVESASTAISVLPSVLKNNDPAGGVRFSRNRGWRALRTDVYVPGHIPNPTDAAEMRHMSMAR